jgi:hypothetical protein
VDEDAAAIVDWPADAGYSVVTVETVEDGLVDGAI